MKPSRLNPALNLVLFFLLCFLAASGLLIEFRLGHGPFRNAVWGMDRHQWAHWHSMASYGLLAVMALHLLLHRRWIFKVACRTRYWKLCSGLIFGLGMAAFVLMGPSTAANVSKDRRQLSYNQVNTPAEERRILKAHDGKEGPRQVLNREARKHRCDRRGEGRGKGQARKRRFRN